jgi:hypothetical protein
MYYTQIAFAQVQWQYKHYMSHVKFDKVPKRMRYIPFAVLITIASIQHPIFLIGDIFKFFANKTAMLWAFNLFMHVPP